MKSICFFSSYFTGERIPYYVKFYLQELNKYFAEVVLLTNRKDLLTAESDFLKEQNIQLRLYENEGMDFGMWQKALAEFDGAKYNKIGLINDSCILFKSLKPFFEWERNANIDYAGMTATGKITFHIQSYFLVINKKAIPLVTNFFKEKGIKQTYKGIIANYEIGLSEHLLQNGMTIGGFYDYKATTHINPTFILADKLIKKGCPLIKKKIFSHNYYLGDYLTWFRNDFNIDTRYYVDVIWNSNKGEALIDLERVMDELSPDKSEGYIRKYKVGLAVYKFLRSISFLRFLFHQFILLRRKLRTEEK